MVYGHGAQQVYLRTLRQRDADEQVEGARTEIEVQSLFSCVNCCANWNADTYGIEMSIEGKKMYTPLRGMRGCNPRPSKPYGGRQQYPGHDHDPTGARVFKAEEGAFSRGIREHDCGSSSVVLQQRSREAIVRIPDVIVCKNSEGVEERMSIFLIGKDLGNVAYSS